jgi:DNA (cytosine-5)-methyltransferase 1
LDFVDLFAGIGGIRLGFENIGWNCVFTSEWDKFAQQTYKANFPDSNIEGDIALVDIAFIPPFDVLLAGFPCQSFSISGLKKGFDDTRGTLFFNIVKIIDYHKPSAIFLENVPNLLLHDKGNTFRIIYRTLNDLGYKVFYKILNAKDFGLPQTRARIFLVCFKSDDVNTIDFINDFRFPSGTKTPTKISNILEPDTDPKYTLSDKMWNYLQERKLNNIAKGKGFGYILRDIDYAYTRAISARYYKDGSEILLKQDNKNPRMLTPREAARIQGFPESFKIVVSDVQAYKQFGNSVAVPVIKSIAENIQNYLRMVKNV